MGSRLFIAWIGGLVIGALMCILIAAAGYAPKVTEVKPQFVCHSCAPEVELKDDGQCYWKRTITKSLGKRDEMLPPPADMGMLTCYYSDQSVDSDGCYLDSGYRGMGLGPMNAPIYQVCVIVI